MNATATKISLMAGYSPSEWNLLSSEKRAEIIAQDMKDGCVHILKVPTIEGDKFELEFVYEKEFDMPGVFPPSHYESRLLAYKGLDIEELFAESAMVLLKDPKLQNPELPSAILNNYNLLIHNRLY